MRPYGPNGDVVESFLDRIDRLDYGEVMALAAAWQAADDRRRSAAWRSAKRAAARAHLEPALERAQSAVFGWSNGRSPWFYPGIAGRALGSALVQADIARNGIPALVDAVSALVLGGLLEGEDFESLYGPFRSIDEDHESR